MCPLTWHTHCSIDLLCGCLGRGMILLTNVCPLFLKDSHPSPQAKYTHSVPESPEVSTRYIQRIVVQIRKQKFVTQGLVCEGWSYLARKKLARKKPVPLVNGRKACVLEQGKSWNLSHILIQCKLLDFKVYRFMELMCHNSNMMCF